MAVFRVMNAEDMMVKEPITGKNTVDITRLRSYMQSVLERNLRYLSWKERCKMREILFRGKRIDNGEWTQGYLFCIWEKAYICWGTVNDVPDMKEVIPETVCEYTGLTDKNGRKIFEGDIVSFIDTYSTYNGYAEGNCVGKVLWSEEEVCFCVTERLSAESWEILQECYVIGNIFDNPDLMEG